MCRHGLTEETLLVPPPRVVQNARGLLKNPAVFDSWAREAHADYGAFDFFQASETRGGWNKTPEALMRAYVHIALFFSLLTLFEVWANLRGVRVDVSTHPPAIVRRALFCHIEAKRMNIKISPHEFLYRQFGAGMITAALMEAIIGGYVSQRARR